MQKLTLLFVLASLSYVTAYTQCDKKYKLKTERIVTIKDDGSEGEDLPFTSDITITKDSIFILINLPNGSTAEVKGKHTETVCKMNADYSEGSIDYKTDTELSNQSETRQQKMTFTLEAKEKKLKLFGVPVDQPGEKICFIIKEKEEIK